MSKTLAVDANFAIALASDDEYSPKAIEIYKLIKTGEVEAFAPTFILVEMLNVLIKKKKADPKLVKKALFSFKESGIVFVDTDKFVKNSMILEELVFKYGVTSYNALYLLVAIEKKCKLLTSDKELLKIKSLTQTL